MVHHNEEHHDRRLARYKPMNRSTRRIIESLHWVTNACRDAKGRRSSIPRRLRCRFGKSVETVVQTGLKPIVLFGIVVNGPGVA